jgi:hypothetical protein
MANRLSKKVPGWAVTAEATAGSVANMHMIRDGKVQMALTQCDTACDAIKGLDKFEDKPVEARTLCGMVAARALGLLVLTGVIAYEFTQSKPLRPSPHAAPGQTR